MGRFFVYRIGLSGELLVIMEVHQTFFESSAGEFF